MPLLMIFLVALVRFALLLSLVQRVFDVVLTVAASFRVLLTRLVVDVMLDTKIFQ
jgi:hypothetical protein